MFHKSAFCEIPPDAAPRRGEVAALPPAANLCHRNDPSEYPHEKKSALSFSFSIDAPEEEEDVDDDVGGPGLVGSLLINDEDKVGKRGLDKENPPPPPTLLLGVGFFKLTSVAESPPVVILELLYNNAVHIDEGAVAGPKPNADAP
jgi:hypothetical protein